MRPPCEIPLELFPNQRRRDPRLAGGHGVELGQRLRAGAAQPLAPQLVDPLPRALVLSRIARIVRVDEDVSVDEARAGHTAPRAWDKAAAVPSGGRASGRAKRGTPPRTRWHGAAPCAPPLRCSATSSCCAQPPAPAPARPYPRRASPSRFSWLTAPDVRRTKYTRSSCNYGAFPESHRAAPRRARPAAARARFACRRRRHVKKTCLKNAGIATRRSPPAWGQSPNS